MAPTSQAAPTPRIALTAVLVDDEQLARDELRYLLEQQASGVEIVAQAANGVEALAIIEQFEPDIVFLDVQMPGLTGFEVARRLAEAGSTAHVIFVTAYDQYAVDAFEVNAVDYLLNPVDAARLAAALLRAQKRVEFERRPDGGGPGAGAEARLADDQLERIARLLADRQQRQDQLAIKVRDRFLLVKAEEIICASMADDSITVVTNQHSGVSNYRTLDELQARLDPSVFWRVHRAHLVNINMIKEIVPWFSRNYILKMKDGKSTEIPVSRSQTRRLRDYLKL
jgi:two-component system response regulator LytT